MLDTAQRAILMVFLATSMAGVGLQVNLSDVIGVARRKGLFVKSLAVNFLLIPILGWLITKTVPMAESSAEALMILACAPGGITAVQFTSKHKDVLAFAGQTAFLLTGLSILVSPFLMSVVLPADLPIVVPYAKAFWYILLFMLIPMGVGIALRARAQRLAQWLGKPMSFIGTIAFVVFVVLTLSIRRAVMAEMGATEVIVMLGFIVAAMIIGWAAGGPQRDTRQVLATASSMRNVALSLAIVNQSFPEAKLEFPMAAFCALMITPNMIFVVSTLAAEKLRKRHRRI